MGPNLRWGYDTRVPATRDGPFRSTHVPAQVATLRQHLGVPALLHHGRAGEGGGDGDDAELAKVPG